MEAYREGSQASPAFAKAWYNLRYLQVKALARTVAEMSANVDPTDSAVV